MRSQYKRDFTMTGDEAARNDVRWHEPCNTCKHRHENVNYSTCVCRQCDKLFQVDEI